MERFFEIIDRVGLKNSRVAAAMSVTPYVYMNVKHGHTKASAEFREAAVNYLEAIGLRNYDGALYREDDLFVAETVAT